MNLNYKDYRYAFMNILINVFKEEMELRRRGEHTPLLQPNVKDEYHSHLAIFVRNAPQEQISEFWRVAATTQLDILKKAKQG